MYLTTQNTVAEKGELNSNLSSLPKRRCSEVGVWQVAANFRPGKMRTFLYGIIDHLAVNIRYIWFQMLFTDNAPVWHLLVYATDDSGNCTPCTHRSLHIIRIIFPF